MHEAGIGDVAARGYEDMHFILLGDPLQTVAPECPCAGEYRVLPGMEQSATHAVLVRWCPAAQQHDAGQQHSPGSARRAASGHGPAWHADPFEVGRADHFRPVRGGE
ncbi:hypothetical protein CFP75_06160 [Amycolatopsis alba DSM 44262]|uniref:Uncharacterized protein n=1 Tax=Amycolatopsis alba DSM 44262 TaxID=1125972 RepID=A0A229S4X8_AMYAL|nr:hypothetical protein CFP75_06160 [Amycolatopsis alba DSM 44262]